MQTWQQALAGDDIVFCQTTLVVCALFVVGWFGQSFIFWRLGSRFERYSFCDYMLPIYGSICLCRAVGISPIWSVGIWFWPTTLFSFLYVGGTAAERLGKSFWVYGWSSFLFGIGFILLADGDANRSIETDTHPLFSSEQSLKAPIMIVRADGQEKMLPIPLQGLVIGSDPKWSQFICRDDGIANMHVRITLDREHPNTVVVEDLSTTQGTYYWDRRERQWHRLVWPMRFHLYQMVRLRMGATRYIVEINPG